MKSLPSPAIAALLSFVFPGLGQWYAGSARRGVLWALPMLGLLVVLMLLLSGGSLLMLDLVFDAENVLALIIADVAFLFYHVAAMFDAYGQAMHRRRQQSVGSPARAPVALVTLVLLALLIHGLPAAAAQWSNNAIGGILPGQPDIIPSYSAEPATPTPTAVVAVTTPTPTPTADASPTAPIPTPSGTGATPSPAPGRSYPPVDAPWAADDRLNMLLIGTDAGPGRRGGRTDTMILLSVEISSGKAALFGFPRNKYNVPLPEDANGQPVSGRIFRDSFAAPETSFLTNIWQRAYEDGRDYYTPQGACAADVPNRDDCLKEARAWRATTAALQNLAGVQVDGVIAVNLAAFRDLVDAVGGVWIDVPYRVYDEDYPAGDGVSPRKIDIKPGCQRLDGVYALAFARSRHQASDYQRMRRQQLLLTAIRRQIDPLGLLAQVPRLFDIAADNLYTTFDRDQIPQLAQVAARVDADRMYRVVFGPGAGYPSGLNATGLRAIRERVRNIFDQPLPEPSPTPSGDLGCSPSR